MANRYWVGGTGTWDATAGTKWALTSGGAGGQTVPTTADTVFFDAASGANTVTIGAGVATCSTLTMTGFTGTIAFGTNSITCAGTGTIYTGATTFSVTGTPLILCSNSSATSRTITPGATTEANSISFNITAGNGTFNISSGNAVKNLDFTGFTGALALAPRTIYGNLTLVSGMTLGSGASTQTFAATSGTQTITSAGLTQDYLIAFTGTATYQLVDALTMASTRTLTLTSGTLDLNNKTLTTGLFATSTTTTRAIAFGTLGNITLTGNSGTIWSATTATNFTYTGTPTVNCTYSGSTGTRIVTFGNTAGQTETNSLSFNISAGSDTFGLQGGFKNFNFTGFTGTFACNTRTVYGNVTFVSGMTLVAGTFVTTFAATSGTQTITSAGLTQDYPITFSGTATYRLQDTLTMGVTRTLTLTSGTLDLNNKTLTTNTFSSSNSNVRSINFGTLGEINLVGTSGTIWSVGTNTNFSVTGTPTVNATDSGVGNTRTFTQGTSALSNQAVSFYVKAGSGTVNFNSTNAAFKTIDLTGFSGTVAHSGIFVLGDYVIPAGVTVNSTANAIQFVGTDATQKITTSGNVMDFPITVGRALTTTAATGNGTTATLTYASTVYYPIVGQTITVSGVVPAGYNGTFTVTASSATSVSYLNATTAAQTTAGTVNLATTVQLQDALTMGARQLSYSSGTIDLNNNTLTTQNVSATSLAPRTILFGTANITLTGNNTTIWTNVSATGYPFIATGTKVVNCTYSGSVGSRNISSIISTPDLYSLNFNITAGSDIFSIQGNRQYNNIDFTGFSGTCVVSATSTANITMYGDWTCPASGGGATFLSSTTPYGLGFGSGAAGKTQTLTSNGYVFDCPIAKTNSSTSILLLADDLVVKDITSTGKITLTNGVFNSGGNNVTCAEFDGNNTNIKTLTLTNSTVTITNGDASIAGFYLTSTNSTVNATGSNIVFTTSGATSFYGAGGGNTWPQVTMSGTGQLIIGTTSASTTITTLTNTVQPCTISIRSGANNTTVTNFNLNGTAGNLVTFNSSVAGVQKPIIKASGTVNAYYLAIQDSAASGGAIWRAISSVNNGNNTGWFFDYTETVIENSILADTPNTTAFFLSNITEDSTIADTPSGSATFIGVITEDTQIADTASAIASFAAAIVEAATLEDASVVLRTTFGDVSEAVTLDNSQTVIVNFVSVVFETIDVVDTQSVVASFAAVITEDTNLQDLQEATAAFVASLSEAITAADSSLAVRIHNSTITENTALADTETVIAAFTSLVSENIYPADAPTVIASFNSQITENLVLLDEPFPRGWYAINDGQTSNWSQVNNTDSSNWTGVDNEQTTVWTKVNNSYP